MDGSENNPPEEGKRIKVQSVRSAVQSLKGEELLAQVCYYYPQYTLQTAALLSYRQVVLLLKTANKLKAVDYYNLVQIAAAPQTKKGEGVKKLSEHFKKLANG